MSTREVGDRVDINRDSLSSMRWLLRQRPDWYDRAACRGMDPNLFYPEDGHEQTPEADDACARCPVRLECYEHSIGAKEDGIWGGVRERTRREERYRRNATGPRKERICGTPGGVTGHQRRGEAPCTDCRVFIAERRGRKKAS